MRMFYEKFNYLNNVYAETETGFLEFGAGSIMSVVTQTNGITLVSGTWQTNIMTYEILLSGGIQYFCVRVHF